MNELWQSLRDQLRVTTKIVPQEAKARFSVQLLFEVRNTAAIDPNAPTVVFTGIHLLVGPKGKPKAVLIQDLKPGESATYEHPCNYDELIDIEWRIEGNVSPEAYFAVRSAPAQITGREIPANAYIQILNGLHPHRLVDKTIIAVLVPSADTTLGDLKREEIRLNEAVVEIDGVISRLNAVANLVAKSDSSAVREHRDVVVSFLETVRRGCQNLRSAVPSGDSAAIKTARDTAMRRLTTEETKLTEATKKLLQKTNPSEDVSNVVRKSTT